VGDREQTAKFLEIIKRNADRLAAIIEDLLELARLEEPGREKTIERVPTPVRLIIDAAAVQFDAAIEEKNLTVRVESPSELVANVNARLIEQAVSNLLSNAIKYSPPGSLIIVRGDRNPIGELEISVSDQGAGIPPKHLPRLFERFYRVDKARSRQLGGTGLGLAIVKHIAQVHGGRAEVQSELGRGSTFKIVIPGAQTISTYEKPASFISEKR
jgi:two-component system phosphate regulon sensor histidine kinase PhoR